MESWRTPVRHFLLFRIISTDFQNAVFSLAVDAEPVGRKVCPLISHLVRGLPAQENVHVPHPCSAQEI